MATMATWQTWSTASTTTGGSSYDDWGLWSGSTSITATGSTTTNTWIMWCDSSGTTEYYPVQVQPSREKLERRDAEHRAQVAAREAAERRAEELLLRFLDIQQRKDYQRNRRFTVVARNKRRYVVRLGLQHNVDRIGDDGFISHNICGYVPGVPAQDNMLMQKMMLEVDDDDFCKRSNVFPGSRRNGAEQVLPALPN